MSYKKDLHNWLPMFRELFNKLTQLADWRLTLVTSSGTCSIWMGSEPAANTASGTFDDDLVGHFVLHKFADADASCDSRNVTDLFPFLCYVPDR